ncbi:MAG TPA: hypothetical protein VMZ28_17770 [Kofleriaceae bacterium]|nr:hypothetical protein [Kofleriaceae bacterium]
MARGSGWFVVAVVAVGGAGPATADPFGGFSRDQTCYLDGADRVCSPVAPGDAAPSCTRVTPEGIARLGFARAAPQRGTDASVTAEAAGNVLRLRNARTRAVLMEWSSPDAITRVREVFVSGTGGVAAVEYDVRVGGRAVARAVAMALPGATASSGGAGGGPATQPVVARVTLTPAQTKALATAMKSADALLARKQWQKAEEAYRKALAVDEQSAAARFGVAAALARKGGAAADVIAELEKLAQSPDEAMPVWRVEARTSAHFAGLRGDAGYRRAVGIDLDPARPLSAYERLVGQGGHWEQPGLPCQEPTVNLKLDRGKKTFVLKIRTRCQGEDETTTLDGRWKADAGANGAVLTFPNASGPDENLECALGQKAGEDTLSCALDDLSFTMRVVRR